MPDVVYNRGKFRLLKALDWDTAGTDVIRALLVETRSTTVGADEDPDLNFVSDLTALAGFAEMTATNYARQSLAGRSMIEDDANNRVALDAADPVFPNLGVAAGTDGTVRAVVIYERVGADDTTPADDPLICLLDVADTITNGANFTVQFAAAGIVLAT